VIYVVEKNKDRTLPFRFEQCVVKTEEVLSAACAIFKTGSGFLRIIMRMWLR
jgi:hypothetical protein